MVDSIPLEETTGVLGPRGQKIGSACFRSSLMANRLAAWDPSDFLSSICRYRQVFLPRKTAYLEARTCQNDLETTVVNAVANRSSP